MQTLVAQLQAEVEARKNPRRGRRAPWRGAAAAVTIGAVAFLLGARTASTTQAPASAWRQQEDGTRDLQRIQLERLQRITAYSARFEIPADLAERIEDIARAEGIDPDLAFGLVRVESEFNRNAVSPVGARGLTQLMPSTARYFQINGSRRHDLFDRDTNLRIGFRFLRILLDKYDGDVRLALLAYNRGPARVDDLLRRGINPDNGYVELVMRQKPGRSAH